MKGVFDTRPLTEYDDDISRRYHFPNRYLSEAERTEKDWIVYREPRRGGGRQAYVAVARVNRIEPDPFDPGSSYAYLSDYLEFDQVVPLHSGMQYYEDRLNSVTNSSHIGVALQGKSVRTITEDEFGAIALAGLATTLHEESSHRPDYGKSEADLALRAFVEAPSGGAETPDRPDAGKPSSERLGVPTDRGNRLQGNLRRYWIADGKRWRQGRGSSCAHTRCQTRRARHRSERHSAVCHMPLALRSLSRKLEKRLQSARRAQQSAE